MKKDTGTVKSVLKALSALDFVMEQSMTRPGVGLSEVAAALEIQPTTTRNILKTMEMAGYIGRAGNRLYVPGPKCHGMSRGARVADRLVKVMTPVLDRLAEEIGESFVVSTLFNGMRKVLLRRHGMAPIVVETRSAEQDNMAYRLVTTRIMLAFASGRELDLYVGLNGLPGREWDGIDSRRLLDEHLHRLKTAGYAEGLTGDKSTYAAAFPLLDDTGMMLGALGIHMPAFRADPEKKRKIFARVREVLMSLRDPGSAMGFNSCPEPLPWPPRA